MAKSRHKKPAKKQNKISGKKLAIIFGVACTFLLLGLAAYKINFNIRVANADISLESLCQGGAVIYDDAGKECTRLNIKKCAEWILLDNMPQEVRGISADIGKGYAELIVEQFFPESKEKKILASALEKKHTKAELEEFYLNTVYLGDGVYGIASAAKHFWGYDYQVLFETEGPVFKDIILSYLMEGDYGDLNITIREASMVYEENGYIDGVVKETAQKLQASGMDELSAYNMIFTGDLRIYTYMDKEIQDIVSQAYVDKSLFTIDTSDSSYIQSAMVIMDTEGKIKAVASGNNDDKVLNRAISKTYQIGSTIKPISTYSLGIEQGIIHFSSMVENEQKLIINSMGEEVLWPSNVDGEYGGEVTVTKALQQSKNTVAVRIGQMVGEDSMYSFLKNILGYDLVAYENQNTDRQLSALTLGYLYRGISLEKLTASYEMFVTGGQFFDSSMVSEVKNRKDEVILTDERQAVQALSEETAYIMNRLLYNNVYGEYGIAKNSAIDGVEVLGKTGTVGNDYGQSISRLFVGVTSDYIAGVWIGYDDETSLKYKLYSNPDEIYAQVMSQLPHSGTSLAIPEDVFAKEYCQLTGMLATDSCRHKETGYYTADNMPEDCTLCYDNK